MYINNIQCGKAKNQSSNNELLIPPNYIDKEDLIGIKKDNQTVTVLFCNK